jgi:hypothetical protein
MPDETTPAPVVKVKSALLDTPEEYKARRAAFLANPSEGQYKKPFRKDVDALKMNEKEYKEYRKEFIR